MSAASVLARAQAAAQRLMVDACTIQHKTGETTDAVGNVVPTYTSKYTGKCKVQQRTGVGVGQPQNVGEAAEFVSRLELHVPVSVTGVVPDDLVTLTASLDVDLVGRTFFIRELSHKTYLSARRFGLIEVTS
jgi:hypothetical protein